MPEFTVYGELRSDQHGSIMNLTEIGKQIRETRKDLGIDQSTLATLAGVGINALGRLERGTGNPRFDVLYNVVKTLGLDIIVR